MASLSLTTVPFLSFYSCHKRGYHPQCLGGRQVDGALPAIYALEQICKSPKIKEAQAANKLTVLFDSGIRTGSDIIKAMALGAQGILRALSQLRYSGYS